MKWNPWHGCKKYSEGCLNCYVYRIDARHGKDSSLIIKNKDFNLPLRKNRKGGFKVPPGETLYTCFSSDFFLEEADPWRADAWQIIKYRSDVNFFIITKRILRVRALLPADWGEGYPNVTIACTAENQKRADERLPEYLDLPIKKQNYYMRASFGPDKFKSLSFWRNIRRDSRGRIRGRSQNLKLRLVPCPKGAVKFGPRNRGA